MNKSHPIVDSKLWKPCATWSENLSDASESRELKTHWKSKFNPFTNTIPTYYLDYCENASFDFMEGPDPWKRPFIKSIFYFSHKPEKPQRTAFWKIECSTGVTDYLKKAYEQSRVYDKFDLLGFTSVNREVVRLYIKNVTSDSLDVLKRKKFFVVYQPARDGGKIVDDERPVPMWII